jgi:CheY-like chemotaxis protein
MNLGIDVISAAKGLFQGILQVVTQGEKFENLAIIEHEIALLICYISLVILLIFTIIKLISSQVNIVKPILSIDEVLEKIVNNEKIDLNKIIDVNKKNEIGNTAVLINKMIERLNKLYVDINHKINALANTSFELSSNISKTSISVKKISMNLKKIWNMTSKQENEAGEVKKTIKRIKENIENKKISLSDIEALVKQTEEFMNTNKETAAGINAIVDGVNQINKAVSLGNDMSNENKSNFDALKQEMDKIIDSGSTKNKIILLVDDDEIHLEMTQTMLGNSYDVVTVQSGNEALTKFHQGFVPDIILLDLIMPDMDGWDTFERIKGISGLHEVPIAFFTSSFEIDDIRRAFDIGVVEYISKPVEKNELLKTVERMMFTR